MNSRVQSRRIVWRLRLLTTTGLLVVIATLTFVGVALWKMRGERAFVISEQRRLNETSDQLRRLTAQSRSEIQATLDGVETRRSTSPVSGNLQRFVQSELNSHPDAAVVHPLGELDALAVQLITFGEQADRWRRDSEGVYGDIREQRSLKKVRGLVAQLRAAINAAPKDLRSDRCAELNDQLAEFARLVEVLAGEEQIDALDELKDKQIKPMLDAMACSVGLLPADPATGGTLSPVLSRKTIDELRVAVCGKESNDVKQQSGSAGGLFALRRSALLLRRDREKLKAQSALLFEAIDTANAGFAQSAQGRKVTLAEQMESSLGDGWRRMLLFGGGCSLVFLYLAHLISRGIYWHVTAIEQAHTDAEKGRLITQKLMLEQQAAAVELDAVHKKLLSTSRQAGMAEVATGVLHNVGNVLNSVNVSSSLVTENLKKSRLGHLAKVVALLREHESDLGTFITTDTAGKQVPAFLAQLADYLAREQSDCLSELAQLQKNIEHIKDIVSMQQAYAGSAGFREPVDLRELAEDALRIHRAAMTRHDIDIVKEFSEVPRVLADKHKILQILVNLVSNAKHAMKESPVKSLTIRIESADGRVRAVVRDTGYGIPPENLTRIFAHGFTTKRDGHGFGLHSGALAAKEIGGSLQAQSDGPGRGATFMLDLPLMTSDAMAM